MSEFSFNSTTHTYRKGDVVLPHITGILKMLQPTEFYTDDGRERGAAVHLAIQKGVTTELGAEYHGYFDAWTAFVRDHNYQSLLAEVPLFHPSGWAGTPDQYGIMGKMHVVFELKTGANHPTFALQTAAQAELIRVNGHKKPEFRFALQLCTDGKYSIHAHKEHSDYAMFLSLLNIHRWKQRHNIK